MRAAASDFIGQILSVLCVVHCLLTPFILALVPAAAGALVSAHPVLLVLVLTIAAWAFIPGYRHHHQRAPVALGFLGLTLLALGTFLFHATALDTAFSVAGAA